MWRQACRSAVESTVEGCGCRTRRAGATACEGPRPMKLLLIEDNPAMQTTLQRTLQRRGMQVVACGDGARALDRWRASAARRGAAGPEPARARRPAGAGRARAPQGLTHAGADPHRARHRGRPHPRPEHRRRRLPAQALRPGRARGPRACAGAARRGAPREAAAPSRAEFCGLRVDADSGAVYCHGQALELAPREAALLRALLARPGQAVAKERLFELVFPGEAEVQSEAIEVVAYRLRKKLAGTGAQLVTLRGLGYLLKAAGLSAADARRRACRCAAGCCWASCCRCWLLVALNTVSLYRQALRAADTAYDRTLLASAKSIGELLEVTGSGDARGCRPPCPIRRSRPSRPTTAAACTTEVSGFARRDGVGLRRPAGLARQLPDQRQLRRAGRLLRRRLPRRAGARGGAAAAGGRPGRPRHGDDPGRRDAGAAPARWRARSWSTRCGARRRCWR